MANSDKNIRIVPNKGLSGVTSATFTGAGNTSIALKVSDDSTGKLFFENSNRGLLQITAQLSSGPLFSVADQYGYSVLEVNSNKRVTLNKKSVFSGTLELPKKSGLGMPITARGLLIYNKSDKSINTSNGKVWATCSTINTPVKQGLLYYVDADRFDSYPGTGATWYDVSGNNYHFGLTGGYTYVKNQGFKFDGTSGYAEVTLPVAFRGGGFNSWTYNTWFMVNGSPDNAAYHNVILDTDVTGGSQNGIAVMWGSSSPGWGAKMQVTYNTRPSSGGGYTNLNGRILTLGTWYNVSVVRTSNALTRLYVNGVLQNEYRGNMPAFGTTLQRIGRWTDGTVFSNVNIAAVGVYDRALTFREVMYNYNCMRDRYGI